MKIKKILLLIIFSLMFEFSIYAQFEDFEEDVDKPKIPISEKIFFGGDFGLQVGSETMINLSPQIGYLIKDYWAIGTGVNFFYYNYQNQFTSLNYGGNVFTQFYPFPFLVLHGEAQILNVLSNNNTRYLDIGLLAGGGYRQKMGAKSSINYILLWNFNQTENSFYSNPIMRISFYF